MNKLKHFCLTLYELARQACLLPQTIAKAVAQRRKQVAFNANEVERLDRIRNPSKYLGK